MSAIPTRNTRSPGTATRLLRTVATVAGLLVAAAFSVLAVLPVFDMRTMIVLSGSMAPNFEAGDAIVVEEIDPGTVEEGDVISFMGYGAERLTTHRVLARRTVDGDLHFRTQGDANPEPDPNLAPAAGVHGVVRAAIPHGGRLLALLTTPAAQIVIVGLPALYLVLRQMRDVWTALRARPGPPVPAGTASVLVLVLVATLGAGTSATLAGFTDAATTGDNTFQTGSFD